MENKPIITREMIVDVFKELFYKQPSVGRKITGWRGCVTYSFVAIEDFEHCGDSSCPGCNMMRKVLKEALIEMTKDNGNKGCSDKGD